jgi:signal transduction histidine kinase
MGKLSEKNGLLTEALGFYRASLRSIAPIADSIKSSLAIAGLFRQQGALDSSIFYASVAFSVAQKTSTYLYISDASAILKDLYKRRKQTDSVFKYDELMSAAKDSLYNRQKLNQMQNLTFNEQQRQLDILKEKEKFRAQLRTYGLAAGLLVFAIIALLLFRNNRFKQRAYTLLQNQKIQTDIQRSKAENTLNELKSTQAQLIQSEKMASLGELTAGIAHEIQNPLNFVNNFSEVNAELMQEMEHEFKSGNAREAFTLAETIKQNIEKVHAHGKRADAIVKSMLQHTRISSGQKELTDINALADEYLRLSYQGLRAKDKSFNTTIKTDFDATVGKINIIPQEVSRVLVNLYNNAFYTVNEKAQQSPGGYEPLVSVKTKKTNGMVEITVKDNGSGIPENIRQKIFQPFFTTKPAGQGTGLGLSLSYDIIKAHEGEIKVQSEAGRGSEFTICLPLT